MKASIHIRPVKPTSERHNLRRIDYDYVHQDLTKNNENYVKKDIKKIKTDIDTRWKNNYKRKRKEGSTPIREGVVLIKPETTMEDLKNMCKALEEEFRIKAEQIHIHRDEGKSREELNLHAHIVFDWTDEKGRIIRLDPDAMTKIQDIVADKLKMERGESKEKTNKRHIESKIFRGRKEYEERKKEEEELKINNEKIKKEIKELEKEKLEKELDKSILNNSIKNLKTEKKNLEDEKKNLENSNSDLKNEIQLLNQQTDQERIRLAEEKEKKKEDLKKIKEEIKEGLEKFKNVNFEDRHFVPGWEKAKEFCEVKIEYGNNFGDPNEMIKSQKEIIKLTESIKQDYNADLDLEKEKETLAELEEFIKNNPQHQTQNKSQRTNLRL